MAESLAETDVHGFTASSALLFRRHASSAAAGSGRYLVVPRVAPVSMNSCRTTVWHRGSHLAGRSIPTCVGTTPLKINIAPSKPVHPHVRGDHFRKFCREQLTAGPSPRAWGPPVFIRVGDSYRRSIPTCVGTTLDQHWDFSSQACLSVFSRWFVPLLSVAAKKTSLALPFCVT